MKKFLITWRGPFTWEEVIEEEGFSDDEDIYAIAWEPPKRANRTRYIGIAISQYIGDRLNQGHDGDYWLDEQHGEKSIRYYLGQISVGKGRRITDQNIKDLEAALIYYHYNFKDICGANVQSTSNFYGIDLEVRNKGNIPPGIIDIWNVGDEWGEVEKS